MIRDIELVLDPAVAASESAVRRAVAQRLGLDERSLTGHLLLRKSVDARGREISVRLKLRAFFDEPVMNPEPYRLALKRVDRAPEVVVVGAGPAGLFAALRLIELGLKPVVLERGRDVSSRKKDIAFIHRHHKVDPDSNYCFGEGGAGTFSDGKLYTRSKKRGDPSRILGILNLFGASPSILVEAHPHIGTDKLPGVIANIRKAILEAGGEIHFNQRVTALEVAFGRIQGLRTSGGITYRADAVILATGHSARDVYEMLFIQGIALEPKGFAMGVRVEHPQEVIDQIQYHGRHRKGLLPAASYTLAAQIQGRGVYSFCMCPGGFIVPSATSGNELVVNGMSPSLRNSPYANSGMVVEIRTEDVDAYANFGVLAGLRYQQELEELAWKNGNFDQSAPAQRLSDFVRGKASRDLPRSSYIPGLASSPLHEWLPEGIGNRLREALDLFGKKMRGYQTNEAIVVGVESRTSSPVRIPRNDETGQHPGVQGLFPCGEGAGYSGGIASSAIDGENTADQVASYLIPRSTGPG